MTTETQAPDPAPLTIYISRMDAETLRSRGRCTLTAYTERVGNESNEVALTTIPAPEGADERAAWAEVEDCLGMYWNAAYAEAKEARDHDDIGGTAQRALSELRQAIKAYALAAHAALAAPAKAPCTHGAEHCTNTSCERLGECQYMAAPAPQAPVALPDVDLCRLISSHEVYQYHPGALHEFSHAVIAEFCRVNGIPAPKEPTHDR